MALLLKRHWPVVKVSQSNDTLHKTSTSNQHLISMHGLFFQNTKDISFQKLKFNFIGQYPILKKCQSLQRMSGGRKEQQPMTAFFGPPSKEGGGGLAKIQYSACIFLSSSQHRLIIYAITIRLNTSMSRFQTTWRGLKSGKKFDQNLKQIKKLHVHMIKHLHVKIANHIFQIVIFHIFMFNMNFENNCMST